MKKNIYKIKNMKLQNIPFTVSVLLCTVIIAMLLNIYFKAYTNPYLMNEILDLSEGWHYSTGEMEERKLDTLLTGPFLQGGETLSLSRILDKEIKDATILLRTNHQSVRIYLDGLPLYLDKEMTPRENPGMALHFLTLPKDYLNKTLQIELTSPYTLYAGRTSPILMGSIPSLEAYVISRSMRSVILMAMSLLIGFGILILTAVQSAKGSPQAQHLSIGIFAVIWALYYVCTEFVVFQFFSPLWVSTLSLGLYYTFQVPLVLYFYFSFRHYKRFLLPPVILHSGFAAAAILLQVLDIVDLPMW